MTLAIVVKLEMVHVTDEERKGLLHANVTAPFLGQVLVETTPVGDRGEAVGACFFALLRGIVALIDENLHQNFQVPLLASDVLNERLQFFLGGVTLPKLDRQAVSEPVNLFLEQDATVIRGQDSGVQIMILVL